MGVSFNSLGKGLHSLCAWFGIYLWINLVYMQDYQHFFIQVLLDTQAPFTQKLAHQNQTVALRFYLLPM